MSPQRIDPYEDLTLETIVEPGDIVKLDNPIQGGETHDQTDYTHGIVVDIFDRFTDQNQAGAPEKVAITKYTFSDQAGVAGGIIDLEMTKGTGIPEFADCLVEELSLVYKGYETGYNPHNVELMALIDHYSQPHL